MHEEAEATESTQLFNDTQPARDKIWERIQKGPHLIILQPPGYLDQIQELTLAPATAGLWSVHLTLSARRLEAIGSPYFSQVMASLRLQLTLSQLPPPSKPVH